MEPLMIIAAVIIFGVCAAAGVRPLQNMLDTRRRMQGALHMSDEWRQLTD